MTEQQQIIYSKHNQQDVSTGPIVYEMQMRDAQDNEMQKGTVENTSL